MGRTAQGREPERNGHEQIANFDILKLSSMLLYIISLMESCNCIKIARKKSYGDVSKIRSWWDEKVLYWGRLSVNMFCE